MLKQPFLQAAMSLVGVALICGACGGVEPIVGRGEFVLPCDLAEEGEPCVAATSGDSTRVVELELAGGARVEYFEPQPGIVAVFAAADSESRLAELIDLAAAGSSSAHFEKLSGRPAPAVLRDLDRRAAELPSQDPATLEQPVLLSSQMANEQVALKSGYSAAAFVAAFCNQPGLSLDICETNLSGFRHNLVYANGLISIGASASGQGRHQVYVPAYEHYWVRSIPEGQVTGWGFDPYGKCMGYFQYQCGPTHFWASVEGPLFHYRFGAW